MAPQRISGGTECRKPLIFMHFHEVFLGSQHEIWSKQHNGKVSILRTQRTIWIVAKRDIREGEELSYNYGFTTKQYRCQCGANNCCGYILGEEYKQDSTS